MKRHWQDWHWITLFRRASVVEISLFVDNLGYIQHRGHLKGSKENANRAGILVRWNVCTCHRVLV